MKQWISKLLALTLVAVMFSGIAWPQMAAAAYEFPEEDIVIDNSESAYVTIYGSWGNGSSANAYVPPGYGGAKYLTAAPSAPKNQYVEFKPSGAKKLDPGYYDVYISYRSASNFSSKVPVEIYSSKDYDIKTVNQKADGGSWKIMGTYYFIGDGTEYVRVLNEGTTSNDYVCADAVRFSPNTTVTAPSPANLDATLSNLQVDAGTLNPAFNRGKTTYDISIGHASELAITATVSDSVYASLSIGGVPVVTGQPFQLTGFERGTTDVPVVVSAVYGSLQKEKTYTVRVNRAYEDDANLKSLSVSHSELSPAFTPDTVTYVVYAGVENHSIDITAEANSPNYKSITIAGTTISSGQSCTYNLGFDVNEIPIIVTAQNGTTVKQYLVKVIRQVKKGDVTGPGNRPDGHFTVADLGLVSYYYGAVSSGTEWTEAGRADFNEDGIIDEEDIQFIVELVE